MGSVRFGMARARLNPLREVSRTVFDPPVPKIPSISTGSSLILISGTYEVFAYLIYYIKICTLCQYLTGVLYLSRRVIPSNPTRNTLYQIQKISAGEISKNMQRGVSGGSPTASGRGGTASVGRADALRALRVLKNGFCHLKNR